MQRYGLKLIFLISLVLLNSCANAQSNYDLDDLEDDEILLNLSATEQQEVDQDTLNATMQYVFQGSDSAEVQSEVNSVIASALELLNESENLEYSTTQYQVYDIARRSTSEDDRIAPLWRAQQGLQITSQNSTELLVMVGELQALGLIQNGLYYSLSSARYEEVSDSMMNAALGKLQKRADQAAESLGKDKAELIEVTLDGNQNIIYNMSMNSGVAMARSESLAVPVADAGKTTVSLTVSARALLSKD